MKVYAVIKVGIYRHEIFGVYASEPLARVATERMLQLEPDDYHGADVVEMELDQDATMIPRLKIHRSKHRSPWDEKIVGICKRVDVGSGEDRVTRIVWEK